MTGLIRFIIAICTGFALPSPCLAEQDGGLHGLRMRHCELAGEDGLMFYRNADESSCNQISALGAEVGDIRNAAVNGDALRRLDLTPCAEARE